MEILNNYLEYRKNKPKYAEWQKQREEKLAKKEQYLKDNPVSKEEKARYIEKANVILNAVDIMDEFSQSKAENTEIATDAMTGLTIMLSMAVGMGAGLLFMKSKGGQAKLNKIIQKHPNLQGISTMLPSIAGSIVSLPLVAPIITWATKNQIFASKIGRHKAVTT